MSGLSGDLGAAPVHEGYNDGRSLPGVVEANPIEDLDKSNNPKIPLMTGICRDETKRAVKGKIESVVTHEVWGIFVAHKRILHRASKHTYYALDFTCFCVKSVSLRDR